MTEAAGNVVPLRTATEVPEVALSKPGQDIEVYTLLEGVAKISDDLADAPLPEGDFDALAADLLRARIARSRLGDLERRIEKAMDECRPNKIEVVEGVGTIERRPGSDRKKWDHEGAAYAVLKQVREENIDFSTGEIQMPSDEALLKAFLAAAGISYWKVTELRGREINPDDFCEKEPGRVTFTITEPPK